MYAARGAALRAVRSPSVAPRAASSAPARSETAFAQPAQRTPIRANATSTDKRARTDAEVEFLIALTNPKDLAGATKLFNSHVAGGKPSALIVAHYLDFLFLHGKHSDAFTAFNGIQSNVKVTPHIATTLIRTACAAGKLPTAQKIFDSYVSAGGAPTARMYASLIAELARTPNAGAIAAAQSQFDQMKAKGIKPNGLVYHALLLVHLRNGKAESAKTIPAEMAEQGIVISPLTTSVLKKWELLQSLPKLKKKKRTPAQIRDGKTVTGAPLLAGGNFVATKEALEQRIYKRELARRSAPPKKPDDYPDDELIPSEGITAEERTELERVLKAEQAKAKENALAAQALPPAPRTELPSAEVIQQNFVPTFYWTLNNHLKMMNKNPDQYNLSPNARGALSKYFATFAPQAAKKH